MNAIATIPQVFAHWMDSVASTVIALLDRLKTPRTVQLIEEEADTFAFRLVGAAETAKRRSSRGGPKALRAHRSRILNGALDRPLPSDWAAVLRGSRIEIVLRADRFLFRPLELPKQAVDFLSGIVRAQIDRLTPWSAAEAVFGCSRPAEAGGDRVRLTVVATARSIVSPYVAALARFGGASVSVTTSAPSGDVAPIVVFMQNSRGDGAIDRGRRVLATVFLATGLTAAASFAFGAIAADSLDADGQALSRKIAGLRAAMHIDRDSPDSSALRMLERRKHASTSSVIVLEALSQILPDHTYVTELRIDGDKMQVVGVTADAPSLIQLIEQSPHFARATFFAPTTQAPGDPGERFHIEARIKPDFTLGT